MSDNGDEVGSCKGNLAGKKREFAESADEESLKRKTKDEQRTLEAKNIENSEYERERVELVRKIEAIRAKTAAMEANTAAIEAKIAYLESLRNGTYFALIDDVFQGTYRDIHKDPIQHGQKIYRNLCRPIGSTELQFRNETKRGEFVKEYERTAKCAESSLKVVADDSDDQSGTSSVSSKEDHTKRVCVFGHTTFCSDPVHLVPHWGLQANTYWFVTDFLFGWDPNRTWDTRFRLLHGVNEVDSTKRREHTGIKHSIANRIVLSNGKCCYDEAPNVVLIPICSSGEVKAWDGKGYEAIALIDAAPLDDDDIQSDASHSENGDDAVQADSTLAKRRAELLKAIAILTLFSMEPFEVATPEEVRQAHELVKTFTNAIVYAQTKAVPKEIAGNGTLQAGNVFETALADLEGKKIRKIRFADHQAAEGHPAPDPILLTTRAAVQLQRRHGIALAEAGGQEDDEMDELSILAMEEFLLERERHREQQVIGSDITF